MAQIECVLRVNIFLSTLLFSGILAHNCSSQAKPVKAHIGKGSWNGSDLKDTIVVTTFNNMLTKIYIQAIFNSLLPVSIRLPILVSETGL